MPEIALRQGSMHYREAGPPDGPVVLMVHGILVDGRLWDRVVPGLVAAGLRVVVPDLPLGSHRLPLAPDADLTPGGLATLLGDLLVALDLDAVTLVANDTGGAFSQLLLASDHPAVARIRGVVLATCDALEVFPPRVLAVLPLLGRVHGGPALLARALGWGPLRRALLHTVSRAGIPDALGASWVEPLRRDPRVLRDLAKVLGTPRPHRHWTLEAAPRLVRFEGPVLLAWARRDLLFPPDLAVRLAACFRDARIAWLDGARTFVPWDRPDALVALVAGLVEEGAARPPVAA